MTTPDRLKARVASVADHPLRPLSSRPWSPEVYAHDETPDGFREVTISVNGRLVATRVVGPCCDQDDVSLVLDRLKADAMRRC